MRSVGGRDAGASTLRVSARDSDSPAIHSRAMEFSHVAVVLPAWKTTEPARDVLVGLREAFEAGLRAVVVDNGSGQQPVRQLLAELAREGLAQAVTVLPLPENAGFMRAINVGVGHVLSWPDAPDSIWVINSDSDVTVATLRELLAVAGESSAGIVSAPEGGPGFAGQGRWPRPFYLRPADFMLAAPAGARWSTLGRCACWCSLFDVRLVRELIARDGAFLDETIFLDWDEWDVSLRAVSLGYSVVAALECGASHHSARSFGPGNMAASRQYYQSRNALIVARRHMPAWQFWTLLPVHFARDVTWLLRLGLQRKEPKFAAYAQGAFDGLRGKRGRWRKHPDSPLANR